MPFPISPATRSVSETDLEPVLATLARERILRPAAADGGAPRYEIYHDVLGEAVLAWRTAHEAEREVEAERERAAGRHRRLLAVLGAGGVLLAVMTGVSVYALAQRGEARTQARTAQARQLDSAAVSQLTIDPELSLVLAAEAARLVPETADRRGSEDVVHLLAGAGDARMRAGACPLRRTAPTASSSSSRARTGRPVSSTPGREGPCSQSITAARR